MSGGRGVALFLVLGFTIGTAAACAYVDWRECHRLHPGWYCTGQVLR